MSRTRIRVIFDEFVELGPGFEDVTKAVVFIPQETQYVSDVEYLIREQYGIRHPLRLELEGGFYIKPNQMFWLVVQESDVLVCVILIVITSITIL